MADLKVWVCQVRKEAFVGGESQRCRHGALDLVGGDTIGCGVMELIGGEPVEWCVVHDSNRLADDEDECWAAPMFETLCQLESQIRVGP